jgi:hypothetical protein
MSSHDRSPLWPSFWHDVPEVDRAPIRDVLAELLGHGVILGSEGSGRDLFLLVRDHYSDHIADYLSPLGLDLVIDDDASLLQVRSASDSCQLLASFSRDATLVILALWRVWDDAQVNGATSVVTLSVDDLWQKLRIFFDRIDPPEKTQIDTVLTKLRQLRLIRTLKPEGMTQPGELQIEVLASLSRVIPFDDPAAWLERASLCQPEPDATPDANPDATPDATPDANPDASSNPNSPSA